VAVLVPPLDAAVKVTAPLPVIVEADSVTVIAEPVVSVDSHPTINVPIKPANTTPPNIHALMLFIVILILPFVPEPNPSLSAPSFNYRPRWTMR
jgi:hypothetical protein